MEQMNFNITTKEKQYLRDLARKYMEYAHHPEMKSRKNLWYKHNSLQSERPVVVMEMATFADDMLPEPECMSPAAREIEMNLMKEIVNYEMINDDKVIPPYYTLSWQIDIDEYRIEFKREYAEDDKGRKLGFKQDYPLKDIKQWRQQIKPSQFKVDRELTFKWKEVIEDVIGDIMPVKIKNNSLRWYFMHGYKMVSLMGMENMLLAMMDNPDEVHNLLEFITDDMLSFVDWLEEEKLLTLNNKNDYAGAGSYGFTDELPTDNYHKTGEITARDLWVNMNSQETVGISPVMFKEFFFPYFYKIADRFGLAYYGCCEPVHDIWEESISKLPRLRKVSISPWCDQEFMGEVLKDSGVIYSRKPSPNYIGVSDFNEDAFRTHIRETIKAASDCTLEFIFRDIYTVNGDRERPGKAVSIVRELIDRLW